jgi:uncharacterized protein YcbX
MRLSGITVYPVKSCRGERRTEATVEPWGLAGDRRWMVLDRDGMFLTQREEPALATITARPTEDGIELLRDGVRVSVPKPGPAAERREVRVWRSTLPARVATAAAEAVLGPGLRLVYMDDPRSRPVDSAYGLPDDRVSFADGYPLLLASEDSLADLDRRMPAPLPMDRFRPSVVVAGAPPWAEDTWRRIRIGAVTFRVVKPCDRCVVTTTDQVTGARGAAGGEPLRTLARFRRRGDKVFFGQNLVPDGVGTIRAGDAVEVIDQADSANWVA